MINFILFGSFFILLLLNVPIAASLGLSSVFAMMYGGTKFTVIPTNLYNGMAKFLLLAIPFFVICIALMLATMGGEDIVTQILLCTPAITAFTVAASIALRRNGFTKTGFFIQFAGPVLFFVTAVLDSIIVNFFG